MLKTDLDSDAMPANSSDLGQLATDSDLVLATDTTERMPATGLLDSVVPKWVCSVHYLVLAVGANDLTFAIHLWDLMLAFHPLDLMLAFHPLDLMLAFHSLDLMLEIHSIDVMLPIVKVYYWVQAFESPVEKRKDTFHEIRAIGKI